MINPTKKHSLKTQSESHFYIGHSMFLMAPQPQRLLLNIGSEQLYGHAQNLHLYWAEDPQVVNVLVSAAYCRLCADYSVISHSHLIPCSFLPSFLFHSLIYDYLSDTLCLSGQLSLLTCFFFVVLTVHEGSVWQVNASYILAESHCLNFELWLRWSQIVFLFGLMTKNASLIIMTCDNRKLSYNSKKMYCLGYPHSSKPALFMQ